MPAESLGCIVQVADVSSGLLANQTSLAGAKSG